ncbi:MAG: tRNA uridine-5-carboxymethylaminomethyl(34) synthesis GTPase MnmE, partial [Lachnospiraceae bacterium]|nr:tRNA uridine-5-carboxymethylaminomethyl(34) synthesis GTPase MnmE [Lachnospiraceae bacterium]
LEGTNLETVEETIRQMFFDGEISFNDEVYITNVRQKQTLGEAITALGRVRESLEAGMPEDFCSIDLIDACEALGLITGETAREDMIDTIFAKFCMGK